MRKFAIIAAVAVIASATFLESCKKGENDPFLSFRSRKGRVAGEWTVTKGEGTRTNSGNTTTWTFDGTTYSETQNSVTTSNGLTMEFTFDKDGTYTSKMVNTFVVGQTTTTITVDESGTWNFTGKIGEDKNKDHIVMRTLSSTNTTQTGSNTPSVTTTTYTGDNSPANIMYVDQLKNKEMIFKSNGSQSSGNSTDTEESTWTLTAK